MTYYLEQIHARRFRRLADCTLGPFRPGMNVVFGPSESGKSTWASLVGALLFGAQEDRIAVGDRTIAPGSVEGSLHFCATSAFEDGAEKDDGASSPPPVVPPGLEIVRTNGAFDEKEARAVLEGVDASTYRGWFVFAAAEAPLSAAPVPLMVAPSVEVPSAALLAEVEQQIFDLSSPESDNPRSVARLEARLDQKRAQVNQSAKKVEKAKQQAREIRELTASAQEVSQRCEELDAQIEQGAAVRESLQKLDERLCILETERRSHEEERRNLETAPPSADDFSPQLLALDGMQERRLRDRLDEFAEAQEKMARLVEGAKQNEATSRAAYEALLEVQGQESSRLRQWGNKTFRTVISLVPLLVFLAAGIPLFIHGRHISSLSFTAMGLGLIMLAALLAAAAVMYLLRPDKSEELLEERCRDAQWVMLQDQKKLKSNLAEAELLDSECEAYLDQWGLAQAHGSLRQAKVLLDGAAEARAQMMASQQRRVALDLSIAANCEEGAQLRAEVAEHAAALDAALATDQCAPLLEAIDDDLRKKADQRQALQQLSDDLRQRIKECSLQLGQAAADKEFDSLKFQCERIRAQVRNSKHELIELILAKRLIERTLAAQQGADQPQVYREASRILAFVTQDQWNAIEVSSAGALVAKSAMEDPTPLDCLSSTTRQLVFFALRTALLLCADKAGPSLPVVIDDALALFDAPRLDRAAQVLAELSRRRQVIVFTSHRQTRQALCDAVADANCLEMPPLNPAATVL